jgi:hypothetical protein
MTDVDRLAAVAEQLDLAQALDDGLTERSPMTFGELTAGHTNMQSVIMVAQVHATLELAEQVKRIADALEERGA